MQSALWIECKRGERLHFRSGEASDLRTGVCEGEWIFFHKDGLRLNAAEPGSAIDAVPMLGKPSGILWKFLISSGVVRRHRTPAGQPTGVAHLSKADGGPPQVLWEPRPTDLNILSVRR